jgi:antitoxin (DNA-binding transcriptional repressor) of toxin-antitoxin stability system
MDTVDIKYAKEHLAELIERAAKGEDVLITQPDGVTAKLSVDPAVARPVRRPGRWKGRLNIPDDVLLAPMSDEELRDWYGEAE